MKIKRNDVTWQYDFVQLFFPNKEDKEYIPWKYSFQYCQGSLLLTFFFIIALIFFCLAFSGFLDIKKYDRTFGAADDQGNSFLSFPKRTTTLHEKPRSLENIYINI